MIRGSPNNKFIRFEIELRLYSFLQFFSQKICANDKVWSLKYLDPRISKVSWSADHRSRRTTYNRNDPFIHFTSSYSATLALTAIHKKLLTTTFLFVSCLKFETILSSFQIEKLHSFCYLEKVVVFEALSDLEFDLLAFFLRLTVVQVRSSEPVTPAI